MRSTKTFVLGSFLLPAVLLQAASRPDPAALLERAAGMPRFGYEGRLMLTQWTGSESHAEEANVYFSPPDRYRYEYLSLSGDVDRIVVGDGIREQIRFSDAEKAVEGHGSRLSPRTLTAEQERELLLKNYRLSIAGAERVLGRDAWVLEMAPLANGKPTQKLWIDQKTNLVLEARRYNEATDTGSLVRFVRIDAPAHPADDLFLPAVTSESMETQAAGQRPSRFPEAPPSLTGGFALQGEDLFEVNGERVRHLRYTDGLLPLSLFLTSLPVESKAAANAYKAAVVPSSVPAPSQSGAQVTRWKNGGTFYTLIGEVSTDLLSRIHAESFRTASLAR